MIVKIIGLVAAALAAGPGTMYTVGRLRPQPDSDDPALDAYRRRQERLRTPSWLDQRQALRDVNGIAGRWL
jgi:hypothetical protein